MELRRFCGMGLGAALGVVAFSPRLLAQPADPPEEPPAAAEPEPADVQLDDPPDPAPEVQTKAEAEPRAQAEAEPRGNAERAPVAPTAKEPAPLKLSYPRGRFSFGSYGRVIAAGDLRGGRGRDADIVAHGARIDEGSYGELELVREDEWEDGVRSRIVSTLAIGEPIFHDSGKFDATIALRNFYVEERGVLDAGLSAWVGSRMYRGDDIYLLDFWPLDNLNTVGGGLKFSFNEDHTFVAWHVGMNLVNDPFQQQSVLRPAAQNQPGTDEVPLLDRPRTISSLKLSHIIPMGEKAGLKAVLYGEVHNLPAGERELDDGRREDLPGDSGAVVGGQVGGFTGEDDTFANLFVRYATGLAAYGEFSTPQGISDSNDSSGAHELLIGLSGNWDSRWVSVLLGGYFRSFRDASPEKFRFDNVDEGIFVVRPQVYFTDHLGLGLEGSYQAQQHGVLSTVDNEPLMGSLWRFGVIPFISPAGRGSFKRPQLRLIYVLTARDAGARSLYPNTDPFARRQTEQFFGVGAEWWFNSSSYGQ
ncbi:MAG: carbohydrate porin [Polyangiaceae bacterium]